MKVTCQSVADFYKLHHEKGKAFTLRKGQGTTNQKNQKSINEMDHSIYVNMFENLCERINSANENGLDCLLK